MMSIIGKRNTDIKLVGCDINKEMLMRTKRRVPQSFVTANFQEALENIEVKDSVLNLSSVIHEIYTYSLDYAIKRFWEDVFNPGFKYIAIRDFCVSTSVNKRSDVNDLAKLLHFADNKQIADFENVWGSLRENRNLVHFLMKYRYIENWEREVHENYFPITLENILSIIPTDKYEIVCFEDYILPYTYNRIKEDFGIELHDNTHIKLLLKRKNVIESNVAA